MEKKSNINFVIVSLLDGKGPTGVEMHFNQLMTASLTLGVQGRLITPHTQKKLWVRFANLFNRVFRRVSNEYSEILARWIDSKTIERKLKEAIAIQSGNDLPLTIYAQDPLSAKTALKIRRNNQNCRVVAVIHFNVSEGYELVMKGEAQEGGPLWRSVMAIERETLPRVDQIIFVSEFMQKVLHDRLPRISRVPQTVIPNFVTVSTLANPHPVISADMISIGTLEPRKNQEFLLRVLARTCALGQRYSLTLVGDGPDRNKLEALCRELKLEDQVQFAGFRKNAARLIAQHRILVHSACSENMPITLIEALAFGRPILAPAVGGITEIYSHAVEGFYWPLDDVEKAASLLINLLSDTGTYRRFSEAALLRYRTRFDGEILISDWLTAILGRKLSTLSLHHTLPKNISLSTHGSGPVTVDRAAIRPDFIPRF